MRKVTQRRHSENSPENRKECFTARRLIADRAFAVIYAKHVPCTHFRLLKKKVDATNFWLQILLLETGGLLAHQYVALWILLIKNLRVVL